ncbi:MAG: Asp-tRNA(Asn)/Glu-tRNA(Gln) amidotransferase subunit GatA [Candidatus Paceibacterota bacterium]|jgi:aspartyl-tRNA(Asn)/glutamyl-tRNA(Gln) amidotransferase subunit A
MIDISKMGVKKIKEGLKAREFSCAEIVNLCLQNIESKNGEINAFLEVYDDVVAQAKKVDELISRGDFSGKLLGLPLAIKDNILIKGKRTSCSSKMLENHVAAYDSTAIKKLRKEGAVFLGRTNMDEFAMGSSTETSAFGVTRNPIDPTRVPGGSSGGSAAAVASNMAVAALGSDTAGSVRQPASLCGVVGLKTTYGAVSRYGLIAMGSSLDQIGPITKKVADAREIFSVIEGIDPMDSTTLSDDFRKGIRLPLSGKAKIGVPREFVSTGVDKDVVDNFNQTVNKLEKAGHEIIDIKLPTVKHALAAYYVIVPAEISANLARFDGVKYGLHRDGQTLLDDYLQSRAAGFGKETRRRIILGTYILSSGYYDAYYKKASDVRRVISREFYDVFNGKNKVDAIVTPTAPQPAFKIGGIVDPIAMYMQDIFTVFANIVGVPAISVPSGTVARDNVNLPVGFQVVAPHFREDTILDIGEEVESFSAF